MRNLIFGKAILKRLSQVQVVFRHISPVPPTHLRRTGNPIRHSFQIRSGTCQPLLCYIKSACYEEKYSKYLRDYHKGLYGLLVQSLCTSDLDVKFI